jgi:hypothetical protein
VARIGRGLHPLGRASFSQLKQFRYLAALWAAGASALAIATWGCFQLSLNAFVYMIVIVCKAAL